MDELIRLRFKLLLWRKIIWKYKRLKSEVESTEEPFPLPKCWCVAAACSNSISTSAQYVTLQKCYSLPSLGIYFFSNLTLPTSPIKLKLGLQIDARVLITTNLNQSNSPANQQQVLGFDVPLTSVSRKLCKNAGCS